MKLKWIIPLLFFAACTSSPSREVRMKVIDEALQKADQSMIDAKPDSVSIQTAEKGIKDFVKTFPKDSLAPKYMMQLGTLYQKQENYRAAFQTFDSLLIKYPQSDAAGKGLFLEAFINANILANYDVAKEKYQRYIDVYGQRDPRMAHDAQLEIERMGKSPDELVKEFEAMQSDSAKSKN